MIYLKRLLIGLLALAYLCLSIGIPVHVHYCMGDVAAVSMTSPGKDHFCVYCGMQKNFSEEDCCRDDYKLFKSSEDQLASQVIQVCAGPHTALPLMPVVVPGYPLPVPVLERYNPPLIVPPDWVYTDPAFLRFRNLRI